MTAVVHRVGEGFSLDHLASLEHGALTRDWFGEPAPCSISFVVACSPTTLFFGGEVAAPARCEEHLQPGEYTEGLWARDVLELFVGVRDAPAYLELNLAPTGAWWACCFDRYRQRSAALVAPTRAEVSAGRGSPWRATLAISLADIAPALDLGRSVVCAILGDPRRFYTTALPPPTQPDFHALISPP